MDAEVSAFTPHPSEPSPKEAVVSEEAIAQSAVEATKAPTEVPTATPTPWIVTPQPQPADVFAAATQVFVQATKVAQFGTPTPTPENMVTATFTPSPVVVWNTPTPENKATATYQVLLAEAMAVTTGTPTPLPENAITVTPRPTVTPWPTPTLMPAPTRTPLPTPTPVFVLLTDETISRYVRMTATPIPTPTSLPEILAGKIAFRSDRFGWGQIFVVDPDGSDLALLTSSWPYEEALTRERVSPDGKFVVYQKMGTHGLDLFICSVDGGQHTRLTFVGKGVAYDPAWSPDGGHIVFASNQEGSDKIFKVRAYGTPRTERLTSNGWVSDKHPSYSSDGSQIVFYSNRTGKNQLWVMNADGTNQRQLLASGANDWDPVWIKQS